ncbi:glycoprotease family-domain-containing protein [Pyronema omphalodes]|nr:glycoprotease family-domain-containing protein [Pyronema omphalodes]
MTKFLEIFPATETILNQFKRFLDTPSATSPAKLLFHQTITSPNKATGGIHPILSLNSHRQHLAPLLASALQYGTPDLIAATRGPGMTSSLACGLDTAKGLSVALNKPLIGVNHMLAHALTPRLCAALGEGVTKAPEWPFLTLLVSGGHTLLVESRGLTSHSILAGSIDIAIGDMLDKVSRSVVPERVWREQGEAVAYGRVLEEFVFPRGEEDWGYQVPEERDCEKWGLSAPLTKARIPQPQSFSFAGLGSAAQRAVDTNPDMGEEDRRSLGREAMRLAFEHVASRIVAALKKQPGIKEVVVSGGVASNSFLRHLLKVWIRQEREGVELICPPVRYCTDQAAMIAWAAAELWRDGWESELGVAPIRKWSLDDGIVSEEGAPEGRGGVLGVTGWKRRADPSVDDRSSWGS